MKVAFIFLVFALSQVLSAPSSAQISPAVLRAVSHEKTVDVIVTLRSKTEAVVEKQQLQSFPTRGAKISALSSALKAFTSKSQAPILNFLNSKNAIFKTYWSTNKIFVKAADLEIIQHLSGMVEVEAIYENTIRNEEILPKSTPAPEENREIQWGVEMVEAPAAWAKGYRGQDVVIAILDTGVRHTHNFVKGNFREVRGWLDAQSGQEIPYDRDGHGTHVMGTIVGADGYGVAPDAKWIACGTSFYESELLECGEWFICPTHANGTEPDCDAAPSVVSNSWGGANYGTPDTYFDDTIRAWNAAGIISVWSNGNNGPRCRSPTYPKYTDLPLIACGATDYLDKLARFSSRGPGDHSGYNTIRPNVAAPGVDIVSASAFSDSGTDTLSGTSMAAPHVTGVIALLLSNGTELTYGEVTDLIFNSASHTVPPTGGDCGDIPETQYPNNAVGHGRITALGAIELLQKIKA